MKKRTFAASTAVLVGSGLVVAAVPAHAAGSSPTGVLSIATSRVGTITRVATTSPLIVHRSGRVAGRASIAAAPKVVHAKKKVRKKHRSRRS